MVLTPQDRRGVGSNRSLPSSISQLADSIADTEVSSTSQKSAGQPGLKATRTKSKDKMQAEKKKVKDQKEVEAECLWWSEASERQVKELESVFGLEFERTSRKLRADIARHQDRIESLLEAERKQRSQSVDDIRQELDNHKVFISELRGQISAKSATNTQATSEELSGMQELMTRMQSDLESTRASTSKHTSFFSEWETHKTDSAAMAAAIEDLRRDLAAADEQRQLQITRIDELVKELGRDFEVTRRQTPVAPSKEDLQDLRALMLQSTEALGHGIEEVSTAMMATEQKLMVELEARCRKAQDTDVERSKQVLDAVSVSSDQLAKQIADECEQRTLEAGVFKARLDATMSQLELMQSRHNTLSDQLQVTSNKLAEPQAEQVPKQDLDQVRSKVEALRTQLSQAEQCLREELLEQNAKTQRAAEGMATLGERIAAVQELAAQASSELAEERSARSTAVAELRRFAEDAAGRAQAAFEASSIQKAVAQQGSHFEITEESLKQMLTQVIAVPELRSDLAMLRLGLQEVDASCKQSSAAIARIEVEVSVLEGECQTFHSLPQRLETLEEKVRKHSAAVIRVDAMEADLQRAAQEPDVRRLEQEIRLVAQEVVPLTSRIETTETEARMVSRDFIPMDARITAVESEVQRLASNGCPAQATLDTLKSEMKTLDTLKSDMKSMQAQVSLLQTTSASAPSGVDSMASSTVNSSSNVPKAISFVRQSASQENRLRSQSPKRGGQAVAVDGTLASKDDRALPVFTKELRESIQGLVRKVNTTVAGHSKEAAALGERVSDPNMPSPALGSPAVPAMVVQTQATSMAHLRRSGSLLHAGSVADTGGVAPRGMPQTTSPLVNHMGVARQVSSNTTHHRQGLMANATTSPRPGGRI